MSKFICKSLHHVRYVKSGVRASRIHNPHFLQTQPFSSSTLKPTQNSSDQATFTVAYLINSCGFSPETALSASKTLKFETPDKPDSLKAFLKAHGFTKTQIKTLIRKYPSILSSNPEKTISPKIEFFISKGFSRTDVARIACVAPGILTRSLENKLIPSFNFFTNLFQSQARVVTSIKRFPRLLFYNFQTYMAPTVEILREAGVPEANILSLLTYQPRSFVRATDKFRQAVEEVEKMGFDPLQGNFVIAVKAVSQLSKSTWGKKVEAYKKWGFSEVEILETFRRQPGCMMVSEDKINGVMDFIVNKMGQDYTLVAKMPKLVSLSLKKRIVPRSAVYQVLMSKGLVKANYMSLATFLNGSENWFLEKVLNRHKEEAPELLKLYKRKLNLAK